MNIFDSNKKRNIIIGIIYDINSKKMIEGKIDQENLRLRELLDVNNTEILDLHNRIFDLNREISSFKEKLDFEIGQNTELRERLDLCVNELEKATTIVRNTQDTLINSEKVSTMGAMVANIAQEITSPLGISLTVSSFIEKMINDYKGNHIKDAIGEEQAKLLDESVVMLGTNIKKSIELISSFKNVIATQVEEERKPFNVNELINQVIINLNNKLKKVKVIVNCDEMVSFKSYQGHFTQIITSLIINSVEHAFESDSKDSTIRIDVLKIPSGIDISFKDNGKGIDKALNETIFEPFYTTRKKKGNLGLGLYIIRSLISKNFSGEIYLKENSEWSTEFKIILKEQKEKGTML
jgi:C4-dicarboxylate-specific signal transduction histidine kinase